MRTKGNVLGAPTERAEKILDAAAAIFADRGYDAASIDDIADAMESTKGLIYHHFRNKESLLLGVLNAGSKALFDPVAAAAESSDSTPTELISQMVRVHTTITIQTLPYQMVNLRVLPSHLIARRDGPYAEGWTALRESRRAYSKLFSDVVERGVVEDQFHVVSIDLAVRCILGVVNWLNIWYRPGANFDADAICTQFERFIVGGLRGGNA